MTYCILMKHQRTSDEPTRAVEICACVMNNVSTLIVYRPIN